MLSESKTIQNHQGFHSTVAAWRHYVPTYDYLMFGTYTPGYFSAEEVKSMYLFLWAGSVDSMFFPEK